VTQVSVDGTFRLVDDAFRRREGGVSDAEGGVVCVGNRTVAEVEDVAQVRRAFAHAAVDDDFGLGVDVFERVAYVLARGLDGYGVGGYGFALELLRRASDNEYVDGLYDVSAAELWVRPSCHQLRLVRVVVQYSSEAV